MKTWLRGTIGAVLLCIGLGLLVTGFLQPGVTCEGEDSSAGCPATATNAVLLATGMVLLPVSLLFLIRARRTEPLSDAGPFKP